ncbi:MAG: LacI family transcriptional regulator [Anaerolineaceae bacterium]|nr:LacI family transcriptional regulator [Anaerolineaceae bacterium]
MSKRSTRSEVAKLARVSVATVSYVVNNGPQKVSPETRQRVLDAVEELRYRPDAIARSLKTGHSHIVGVIVPTVASPGMAMMANIIQETLASNDYFAIIASTRERQDLEEKMVDLMVSQSVDGLIVCPVGIQHYQQLEDLADNNIPLVFMDRHIPDFPADRVMTDNVAVTKQAVRYLVKQGCRKMVCISFSRTASSAIDRFEGCLQGLQTDDGTVAEIKNLIVEDPTGSLAEAAFFSFIESYGLPDGIVCTTQEIGISVLKALRSQKIAYPMQKFIIFDADWAEMMMPPLPMISQNFFEIGRKTVQLLIERMKDSSNPFQFVHIEANLNV